MLLLRAINTERTAKQRVVKNALRENALTSEGFRVNPSKPIRLRGLRLLGRQVLKVGCMYSWVQEA